MIGMSTTTGRAIGTLEHIRQSIGDILATPVGTRVMRREYGSLLPYLIDAPMDQATVIDIIHASAGAIARWEPRVLVDRIAVDTIDDDGHLILALDVRILATGEAARLEGIAV